MENSMEVSQKIKDRTTTQASNPAIPLLGIYPKIWNQSKCPLRDEGIKKMWHTYRHTLEYYSAMKKNEYCHLQHFEWPGEYYALWNKTDRERQILYVFTYIWNLQNNWTI